MINKRIIDALKPLNIPVAYMTIGKQADRFIVFTIYNENDTDRFDNKNLSETYYVSLNYWYKNPNDLSVYKQIKQILKENKFKFDGSNDLKEGDYYGKNLDFIVKEFTN